MADNMEMGAQEMNESLNSSQAFIEKNKKAIFVAIAAIIVVILGIFAYNAYIVGPREEKQVQHLVKDKNTLAKKCLTRPLTEMVQTTQVLLK